MSLFSFASRRLSGGYGTEDGKIRGAVLGGDAQYLIPVQS